MQPDNMKGVDSSSFSPLRLRRTRPAVSSLGREAPSAPIKAIQKDLARIGTQVRPTGVIDEATVRGVNGVFDGWSDAPRAMTTGKLTTSQISKNAPVVARYLHKAISGMTTFASVNE